ncbi:MAG: FlgO family outer membrane protein [Thermodesulfobacteriota bacterium]
MKKNIYGMGLVAAATLLLGNGPALGSDAVVLKQYALDHPHQVPSDYVYRTPRVFSGDRGGVNLSWDWLKGGKKKIMPAETGTQLKLRVRELVVQLLAGSTEPVPGELRVTVASFVNLDEVYETSALGRYLGEQMLHELQLARVDAVDVRMMPAMQISKGHGEYVLSRDMNELNYAHQADAVVAGTYSVADGQIFVNARLLENGTGLLLSSSSIVFDVDGLSAAMLKNASKPLQAPTYEVGIEKFPVSKEGGQR